MSLNVLAVTNASIDLAQEPQVGGDVITVPVTATSASPAVFTAAADYSPTLGDRVKLGGVAVPTGFTAGTQYYVVSPSGKTFELSATSGGSAINSSSTGTSVEAYLNSKEIASGVIKLSFKPSYTVVVANPSGGSLTLQDSDDNSTFGTLAVCATPYTTVILRKRYIKVSTAATLYLLNN